MPHFSTFPIDDISVLVDKVALLVHFSSHIVSFFTIRTFLDLNFATLVLFKDSNDVLDVIAFAVIIKKLLNVAVIELLSIEFLPTLSVNNVAVASLDQPAKSVDSAALLVNVEALLGLEELGNGATTPLIVLEVYIAHKIVWVEVKLLKAEWCRYLALFIDFGCIEELLIRVVLKNVSCQWVGQVTSNVRQLSGLIDVVTLIIFEDNNISTVVSIKFSKDIIDIKSPIFSVRRHLNWMVWFVKILDHIIIDLNDSL